MIIVTKPYVSEILADTLSRCKVPILKADHVNIPMEEEMNLFSEQQFFDRYRSSHTLPSLLCNSEASLQVIGNNLQDHPTWKMVNLFKNKAAFRSFMQDEYPQFYFQTLELSNWDLIDPASLPYPIIVKPVIGYSSIGVYRVENAEKWNEVKRKVRHVLAEGADMYSADVVNTNE
jgi:hypothetical protein